MSEDRPLQPERRQRVRRNTVQTRKGMIPKDDRTLKSNANVHLCRPAYSGAKPMVIRILPNFNPDIPGDFDPTRLSADPGDFSEWAVSAPAARYIGMEQKFTFLLYDPLDQDYDSRENPYEIFWNAIKTATRTGEAKIGNRDVMTSRWNAYMPLGAKQCIDKPKYLTFYQALVYQNYNEVYVKGGDAPLGARDDRMMNLVQVSTNAHKKLCDLLDTEVENYDGPENDWEKRYKYGDFTRFDGGKFVVIYNPKSQSLAELIDVPASSIADGTDDEDRPDTGGAEDRGYSIAILDKFKYSNNGRRYSRDPDITKNDWFEGVTSSIRWWDDLLHFPSHEEICRMMAVAYRDDADLLRYAWRTHSEFFTDEVEAVLKSRTTVPMGGRSDRRQTQPEQPVDRRRSAALYDSNSFKPSPDEEVLDDDDVVLDDPF